MAVLGVYEIDPPFPATAVHADAVRFFCNHVWVDHTGDKPTDQEVLDMSILVRYAQAKRFEIEQAGFLFNGMLVTNDDHSIILANLGAETLGDEETVPFIDKGINFGEFSGLMLRALRSARSTFMKNTFITLATILPQIYDGTITTTEEIDAAAWPS